MRNLFIVVVLFGTVMFAWLKNLFKGASSQAVVVTRDDDMLKKAERLFKFNNAAMKQQLADMEQKIVMAQMRNRIAELEAQYDDMYGGDEEEPQGMDMGEQLISAMLQGVLKNTQAGGINGLFSPQNANITNPPPASDVITNEQIQAEINKLSPSDITKLKSATDEQLESFLYSKYPNMYPDAAARIISKLRGH